MQPQRFQGLLYRARPGAKCITTIAGNSNLYTPSEEHKQLRDMVRSFAEAEVDPQALVYNREERFNLPLFRKCGELGLLGVTVPLQYGGSGMDATAAVIVHEELSAADPAFCLSYLAHSMLFVNNLAVNGSEEQKKKHLPSACSGETICGMGMSEANAGTDVLGMSTTATKSSDSKHYTVHGSKMWITNGAVDREDGKGLGPGDAFLVYARTGKAPRDVSMFIVEKGMEGFDKGQVIKDKCGMRASTTSELIFDNVNVPASNLVGQENGALLCMMRNLEIERVALGAMSLGIARRCIEVMNRYAHERHSFGQPISSFGQIQRHIAESYAEYQAGRALTYSVSNGLDLNHHTGGLDADAVKLFTSQMAKNVADRAMQVLGGNGYTGEYQVERLWRDAKLIEIGGGTLEAHHKNMVRDLKKLERLP